LFAEGVRNGPGRQSVRASRSKLIEAPEPEIQRGENKKAPVPGLAPLEFYLPDDPGERNNVVDTHLELLSTLKAALEAHRGTAATTQPAMPVKPLGEKTRRELCALGYLE
jgi:hypothetical protein